MKAEKTRLELLAIVLVLMGGLILLGCLNPSGSSGSSSGSTNPGGTKPGGTDPGGNDPGGTNPGSTDPGVLNPSTPSSFNVSNATEWNNAFSAINSDKTNKSYTINIINDFSLPGNSYAINRSDITLTIQGNKTISLSSGGHLISIYNDKNFILQDVTLKGMSNNEYYLVEIFSSGQLTMQGNSSICNNYGGGVEIHHGTFIMNGGAISGNSGGYGGGVYVNDGTFTMNGGTISGNNSLINGGGVGLYFGSTFTMNGGTIFGNTAKEGYGGGVYLATGSFTMKGGTITNNIATAPDSGISGGGGVVITTGSFSKTGGTITGYASDPINGNVAKYDSGVLVNDHGHAVYCSTKTGTGFSIKRKETTAGPGDNLYYNNDGTFGGAWDY